MNFVFAMIVASCLWFMPKAALAHASGQSFVLLLPTGLYTIAGLIAVIATVAILMLMPAAALRATDTTVSVLRLPRRLRLYPYVNLLAAIAFFALLYQGFTGSRDPLANSLTLGFWVVFWMSGIVIEGLFFSIWHWLNPWRGLYYLIRRITGIKPVASIPGYVGAWPGVLVLIAFACFTLADTAPDYPPRLAMIGLLYWLFSMAGMLIFGIRAWSSHVEIFSMTLRHFGKIRPFRRHGDTLKAGVCGWSIMRGRGGKYSLSNGVFVLVLLGVGSFDGFNGTFFWLDMIGVNPLAFPGRSQIIPATILGLLASCMLLVIIFAGMIKLGAVLANSQNSATLRLIACYAPTLLPIAFAYHFAHYLPSLLIDGQYVLLAIDTAVSGNLFGLSAHDITDGFFKHRTSVEIIWRIQAGAIVMGHIVSLILAHHIALRDKALRDKRNRIAIMLSQLPVAVFMIGYTWLGLWLLATPSAV